MRPQFTSCSFSASELDRRLRWLVVTPDMHRVHHSVEDDETNSNFGFNLSLWGRFFGTYRAQPRGGHEGMTLGIREYREPRQMSWLPGILALPFRGRITGYAIDHRQWADAGRIDEYVAAVNMGAFALFGWTAPAVSTGHCFLG